MKTKIKLALVEDNPSDLAQLLRDFDQSGDVEVHRTFMNGADFLTYAGESAGDFDVAVIDYRMPILNGLETFRNLYFRRKDTKMLLVSHGYYSNVMEELISLGTQNYCRKLGDVILNAIYRLMDGRTIYDNKDAILDWEGLTRQIHLKDRDESKWREAFTPLERKIMAGMSMGLGSKEIADRLGYETSSIEKYRGHILHTAELKNSQQLIAWAFANGLIDSKYIMEYELNRLGIKLNRFI